jgi:hypothetical protein
MSDLLPPTRRIPLPGRAPEDVVVDREGWLACGVEDGRLLRVHPETNEVRVLAHTGGRPLGLEALPDGRILVCDSPRGLLRVDPATGEIEALVEAFQGRRLPFCSNVVAARDGAFYFSTSSARYTVDRWRHDMIENIPTGSLFRRGESGALELLLDGLNFANGLALSPDESSIIVAESGALRLRRLWLAGPQAGRSEVFCDLPGYPDNLSTNGDGLIWVAMAAAPNPALELARKLPIALRRIAARIPAALQPDPKRIAWVLAVDQSGRVAQSYRWDDGRYAMATGVCQAKGTVYLGSLSEDAILAFDLPTGGFALA